MELDANVILLDLVKGQEKTQQMVTDMSNRLFGTSGQPGALFIMHDDQKALEIRVQKVENKVWWATGFGAALGSLLSYVGFRIHH